MGYLQRNKATLHPYVRDAWAAQGARSDGSWPDVFGEGADGEEIFQAWGFAAFANQLAKAGKAAYGLPMYVNVALNRPGRRPGEYPSAGPLPHLFDIWKAGGPQLDLLGLDIYFPNFTHWANQFKRPDNVVFIPEAHNAGRPDAAANAFYAFGQLDSIGFSPFSIEDLPDPVNSRLTQAYAVLRQLSPTILAHQGRGTMRGFKAPVDYEGRVDETPQAFELGGYRVGVTMVDTWIPKDKQDVGAHGGLIVQTGPDEFLLAGSGVIVTFADATAADSRVGLEQVIEGHFGADGRWVPGRWLNGDQTHQGRHLRLPPDRFSIQRVRLYRYH
jgi:beta-galactosidase GanA